MPALDQLEQGDEVCVVEKIVIAPPPVNGVAVDLISLDAAGAQKGRNAIRASIRAGEQHECTPRRVASGGESRRLQRGERVRGGGGVGGVWLSRHTRRLTAVVVRRNRRAGRFLIISLVARAQREKVLPEVHLRRE